MNRQTVMPKLQTRAPSPFVDELMDEAVVSVSPPKAPSAGSPTKPASTGSPPRITSTTLTEAIKPPQVLETSRQKLMQAMFVEKEAQANMPQPPVIGSLRPQSRSPSRSPPMRPYRSHSRSRSFSPRSRRRPPSGGRCRSPSPRSRDSRRSSPYSGSSRSPSRASSRDSRRSPAKRKYSPSRGGRRRSLSADRGRNRSPPKTKRGSRHSPQRAKAFSPKSENTSPTSASHSKITSPCVRHDSEKQDSLFTRREGEPSPFIKDYSTEDSKSDESAFNVDPLLSLEVKSGSGSNVWNRLGGKTSDDEGDGDPDDIALVSRLEEVNDTELAELLNSVPDAFPHLRHLTPQQVKEKARSLLTLESGDNDDLSDLSDWSATTPSRDKKRGAHEPEERQLTDISDIDMDELDLITNPKVRSGAPNKKDEKARHHGTNIDPKLLTSVSSCSLENFKIHKNLEKEVRTVAVSDDLSKCKHDRVKSQKLDVELPLTDISDLDLDEIELIPKSEIDLELACAEQTTKDMKAAGSVKKTSHADSQSDRRKSEKEVSSTHKVKESSGHQSRKDEHTHRKEADKVICTNDSHKQAHKSKNSCSVSDTIEKASHHEKKKENVATAHEVDKVRAYLLYTFLLFPLFLLWYLTFSLVSAHQDCYEEYRQRKYKFKRNFKKH